MTPDDFKESWQTQTSHTRLTIDADLLVKEVRRNQRHFTAMIFWRDVREIGVGLLMVPLWLYLGAKQSSPWTWYLTIPAVLWVAGFMLVDRFRHNRRRPERGEPLRQHVESSLSELEHQIWLLQYVFWWSLLPLIVSFLAFFAQAAWQDRGGGWWTALAISLVVALGLLVFAGIYWLNQFAIHAELEPRRQELQKLLSSLKDESPDEI